MLARKFKDKDVEVIIKEDEDAYFYAMKDREMVEGAIKIAVKINGEVIANYHRQFKTLTTYHYNNFLKKFLEEPSYRNQFITEGNWKGTISYTAENGVNKSCEKAIQRLNSNKNPKFKDFAVLKTYGRDKFSSAKKEKLIELISHEAIVEIEETFDNEKLRVNAMRWVARGLKSMYAIRKIKTDLEISKNVR